MTKAEFIERYKHEIFGLVLDASHNRHRAGAELSQWTVDAMRKVFAKLSDMYDDLIPPPLLTNGLATVNPVKEAAKQVPANNGAVK